MTRKGRAHLRLSWSGLPLYVNVEQFVTPQYAYVTVTAPNPHKGWRKGSSHVVPTWRLSEREAKHRRRWWR